MKLAPTLGACAAIVATVHAAEARVTKIMMTRIESPTFEGRSFGDIGPYEKLVGRVNSLCNACGFDLP